MSSATPCGAHRGRGPDHGCDHEPEHDAGARWPGGGHGCRGRVDPKRRYGPRPYHGGAGRRHRQRHVRHRPGEPGEREFPTQGSAALNPREQAWEAVAEPAGAEVDARPAPRLRVAPPRPVAVPRAPFVAMILVLVVGGVLGILVINTKINENAFRLDGLQTEQAALDVREQKLEREIAQHEAPGNLTARARQLGLVESTQPAFIRLPDGQVIGIPKPAGGEPAITSQQGAGQ
ncbi:hypothetical protein Prubr_03910 [Polymorphospora rubra]|uniref:Cell division protein FtsL n=1 Tax=Polymorphospora rubra TaxID=338584 RepID=A0A810MSC0_9ACTN|nr:hypothetical protein Prubr_03910 [Polymorphospora rubra]